MGRKTGCTRDQIMTILEMIDSGNYTQKEIARRYDVTPATISNYNRLHRARFKNEKYASIITKQHKEIYEFKKRLNLLTEEDKKPPKGFKTCCIGVVGNNGYLDYMKETEDGVAIYGYFTKSRLDAKQFVEDYPQYYFYTVVGDISNKDEPSYLKSDSFVRRYGFFVTRSNLGHLSEKAKLKIIEFDTNDDIQEGGE